MDLSNGDLGDGDLGHDALVGFADEVGSDGPVTVVGGRTQWDVGGSPVPGTREVRAPVGVAAYEPAEMVVRCGAGTTVADLDAALAQHGQTVALPDWPGATVGGVLSVGRSGLRRLRLGPVRDTLLEARFVSAGGRLVKAGGPVVKNVSGFDLCRLLVGSLGTIGLLAQVVLRVVPLPATSVWFRQVGADPFEARRRLQRPSAILWDGTTAWVLLEGHAGDVAAEVASLPGTWQEAEGPPPLPTGGRASLRPGGLRRLTGTFVAEVGVGVVHLDAAAPSRPVDEGVATLNRRVKAVFDPTGRLNPGRAVMAA